MVAREIKAVISGSLNATINSCPPFPGKERHYLREQLARISHATEIVPKGMFEVDEETNEVKETEEFTMPSTAELESLEAWGHKHPILLKVGRCSHVAPAGMDEEAKDEYMAKLEEEDKKEERFRPLTDETYAMYPGLETAWSSKVCGDP